jgi:hypothetical protein
MKIKGRAKAPKVKEVEVAPGNVEPLHQVLDFEPHHQVLDFEPQAKLGPQFNFTPQIVMAMALGGVNQPPNQPPKPPNQPPKPPNPPTPGPKDIEFAIQLLLEVLTDCLEYLDRVSFTPELLARIPVRRGLHRAH